jgi:ion channel
VGGATSSPLRDTVTDRFGLVLVSSLVTYFLLVDVNSPRWIALAAALPVSVTVVLSIWASSPGPFLRWTPLALIAAGIVTAAVTASLHGPDPAGVSLLLAGLSLGLCIVAILARMATHTKVSVRTVLAVVSSYVMLGLFFAYLDSGIGHIMGTFFAQPGAHSQSDYAYLSYITLTTVGFGDLTPGTSIARSVITFEALVGQIFLVTLVARMVSLFGTQRAPFDVRTARKSLEEDE